MKMEEKICVSKEVFPKKEKKRRKDGNFQNKIYAIWFFMIYLNIYI